MSDGTAFLVVFILFVVAALSIFMGSQPESREHNRCVEDRRIELVVGMEPRNCPPLGWWDENWSHVPADHE